jgi:mutator protein MutT
MANSQLYGNTYKIPSEVLKTIQATLVSKPSGEGVRRAKFMLKNGVISYQAMKRLKNYFDYYNPQTDDKIQYALAGGDLMKSFIDRTLNANRDAVQRSKDVRRDMTTNPNSELKPYQTPRLNENEKKKKPKENAIAVIVDNDNKILLLKRADEPGTWMPNKYAFVGGGIEKGETPEEACKREIQEETKLDIDKFIKSFSIQKHESSIEYVFVCRYTGEPTDVELNDENTNYGWFSISEIEYLDIVPHLMEYLTIIFKEYE